MKLLLSCVNNALSFIGYDWGANEIFWSSEEHKGCGVCYEGPDLVIAGADKLIRLRPRGRPVIKEGLYDSAHSVGLAPNGSIVVADTGNSRLVWNGTSVSFVEGYHKPYRDAIHLNSFAFTSEGLVVSSFSERPYWRHLTADCSWFRLGYGVLWGVLNYWDMPPDDWEVYVSYVGLNTPHSLIYRQGYLFLCESAIGVFKRLRFVSSRGWVLDRAWGITDKLFLRGAWSDVWGDVWYLGGSAVRPQGPERLAEHASVFRFDVRDGRCEERVLKYDGEIYDILPWRERVLESIVANNF